jgi:TPP-dependent pyruvate/acetoin dehydrogenase alpha subunit
MKKSAPPRLDQFYQSLCRIRRVEEQIARVYPSDVIKSPVHLSIGQEAVSVGVCAALEAADVVFGTYRSHASYLAKGGDLGAMVAELYGKSGGCARGKGGSMHLVDVSHGVMGTSAVVGTTIPNAVGYAYAQRLLNKPVVVVSFFGDGATEEGVFYESLNFAALKELPVLFVCENNGYAIHTHISKRQKKLNLCERARSFGMEADQVPDNDVERIYETSAKAVERLRQGQGPHFIECATYRWKEHVGPNEDYALGYRSRQEAEPWMSHDAVQKLGEKIGPARRQQIEQEVDREIAAAFEFAQASPFPGEEELHQDVFKA